MCSGYAFQGRIRYSKRVFVGLDRIDELRRCYVDQNIPEEFWERQKVVVEEEEDVVDDGDKAQYDGYYRSCLCEGRCYSFSIVLVVLLTEFGITVEQVSQSGIVRIHREACGSGFLGYKSQARGHKEFGFYPVFPLSGVWIVTGYCEGDWNGWSGVYESCTFGANMHVSRGGGRLFGAPAENP